MTIGKGDRVRYLVMRSDGRGHGLDHIVRTPAFGTVTRVRPKDIRRGSVATIRVEDPRPGCTRYVERYVADITLAPRFTEEDLDAVYDELAHAARHADEVLKALSAAYHSGTDIDNGPAVRPGGWRTVALATGIITTMEHVRDAVITMRTGGLAENYRENWFIDDAGTDRGPYLTLAEALAARGDDGFVYDPGDGDDD